MTGAFDQEETNTVGFARCEEKLPAVGHFYLPVVPGTATVTELVSGETTARLVLTTAGDDDCASFLRMSMHLQLRLALLPVLL